MIEPSSGEGKVLGKRSPIRRELELRRKIAYVSENSGLRLHDSQEIIRYPLVLHGWVPDVRAAASAQLRASSERSINRSPKDAH